MPSDDVVDFGADAPKQTDSDLARVSTLALRQRSLETEVIRRTAALREALNELRQVSEVELPDAMRDVGISELSLTDGTKVKLETKLIGTKLTNPVGLAYVEDNGGASLIKTALTIEMDRGDVADARELVTELRRHKLANKFKRLELEEHVHQSTIAAFCREKIEDGEDVPLDHLGVHRRTSTIVGSRPKTVEITGFVKKGEVL